MSIDARPISADPVPSLAPDRAYPVEGLAAAIRRLGDVAVETAVEPEEIADVTRRIDDLTARLGHRLDTSPFSGLTGPNRPTRYSTPDAPMPLNPIIGACSPVRPDVTLVFEDGEVRGTATFSKRFVGPPGSPTAGSARCSPTSWCRSARSRWVWAA